MINFSREKKAANNGVTDSSGIGTTPKSAQLKKLIIKNSIALFICLGILAGISGLLILVEDDFESDRQSLSQKVNQRQNDVFVLKKRLEKAGVSLPKYKAIVNKFGSSKIELDRREASERFQVLKERYFLTSLRINLSGLEDIEIKNDSSQATRIDVSLSLDAVSDAHILAFFNSLRKEGKGLINLRQLQLRRVNTIEPEMLLGITQGTLPSNVSAIIEYEWYGMRDLENTNNAN